MTEQLTTAFPMHEVWEWGHGSLSRRLRQPCAVRQLGWCSSHPSTQLYLPNRPPVQYPHPIVMPDGGLVVSAGKTLYRYQKTNNPFRFAKQYRYQNDPHPARS